MWVYCVTDGWPYSGPDYTRDSRAGRREETVGSDNFTAAREASTSCPQHNHLAHTFIRWW